jgi:hypothetical protein
LLVVEVEVEQEMGRHLTILVEEVVQVLIEQTVHLFLDHKQYLFKLVLVVREHLQHQRTGRE